MENFRTTYNNNTTSANEALQNLGAMFKNEKLNLEKVCTGLQQDHASFQTSLTSQITKLHDNLAMESAVQTCITDVTSFLSDIIETRDSMISITVRKHLAEKLSHVFAMLYRLQGVSPQSSKQKQGEKVQGKEKLTGEEPIIDDDEDKEPDEAELKRQKDCDAELNETQGIVKEAKEKERAEMEAQAILKSRTLLFSKFRAFVKVANAPFTDNNADQMLFSFYLKHMKPHLRLQEDQHVRPTNPLLQTCLALNPNDWIILYNILLQEKDKYKPVMSYLQLMIKLYIQEVGSMDVDIATVLKKKPTAAPKEAPKDL
ncbi:unnamed protein product [Lactuca saligna]|uniref:Uncharacterized protein n=1 Tax=Lactuca saligna TaxID=75948 RepID=A0AA35ZGY5_LACSI|nr:unnamed protein product [Lactuca saligna]